MAKRRTETQTVTYTRQVVIEKRTCPVCKKTFEGTGRRVYCSVSCRSKADYQKHANARREARLKRYRAQQKERSKR